MKLRSTCPSKMSKGNRQLVAFECRSTCRMSNATRTSCLLLRHVAGVDGALGFRRGAGSQTGRPSHVKLTRNSPGDEIANVNLRRHCIRTTKYNRLLHKFRHRSFSATQVYQLQWNNAVQGHSRSPILAPIEIYDFLLVINSNLPPILHRYQVMADYWSNFR